VKLVFVAAWLALTGVACVDINGGAVEVPWIVFARDGRGAINDCACATPAIQSVRLKLEPAGANATPADPCAEASSCVFSCGRKIGSTPFMVPPGDYLMSIEPLGTDGLVIPEDAVPAPVLRRVQKGAPTELDAFEIQAPCGCHGDDVQAPCA
jgi:hypothetical protein